MATHQEDYAAPWYLVQCKSRQDERAEENLRRQGYQCYRPQRRYERIIQGRRRAVVDSLFPGYLFIALGDSANWAPLRSTRGVNRLVAFNGNPLAVAGSLIEELRQRTSHLDASLLLPGETVRISEGCFADLEAIFESAVGEERVILLLTLLNRQQRIELPLSSIHKM
ncbi:transcription/translation regulatory transformer protein RfaH [Pseudomonas sp. CF161]|uniref:transcription/translation regulatory transformer protein RfaH n=1 Tax=Pseudomonas sp. CF161 TaxID=911241 RepID=UPI00035536ED|nr:transcription/translation regulatory transformer protein RfaH [Pseudomonas sp. CF161]EPL08511.1 transcriptional activator RfaH [Pseudomonas sp. CF161]